MHNDLATVARIRDAEDLASLASDLAEAVMFIAERDLTLAHLTDADKQELTRILTVAAKLKARAQAQRIGARLDPAR